MPNIIDYLKWRGDIPFTVDPFNEIDSLIFAELSYIPFELVSSINLVNFSIFLSSSSEYKQYFSHSIFFI